MKDYYKILGVPPSASQQEVKRSYRVLAFKYHPDKNPDSSLAEARFKEIQEAYATISDSNKRAKYDDERWLMGMGGNTQYREAVTPAWLATISQQLNISLALMDTHRISQRALQAYILLIITDAHIGVLQQANDKTVNETIVQEVLKATGKLQVNYLDEIYSRLLIIAADDPGSMQAIQANAKERTRRARQEKMFPYIIILVTLALCLFMYLYGTL
jgi:molecular chaperone DnaJ